MAWPTKTDFVDGDVLNASQMNNIGTNLNIFNPTSATNGQVLTANGSGGVSYAAVNAASYTQLTSGTITNQATTDITGFSQAYKHLEVWLYNVNMSAGDTLRFDMFAGTYPSSGTTTTATISSNGGTGTFSDGTQSANGFLRLMLGEGTIASANTNNFFRGVFYNYSSTTANKTASGFGSFRTASSYYTEQANGNVIQTTGAAFTTLRLASSSTITSANYILWGIQ